VVELGVGKNMVAAIAFWMKAFGLIDKEVNLSDLAKYILDDKGKDFKKISKEIAKNADE